jgi:2-oxoglutarate dehydrogenase E2 component (dihydrolipoamide succinyltransferase)
MSIEVLVPHLPESVADATLSAWHKQPGETVKKDENLVDLETDKVVLEVPAPEDGVLKTINQPDGATVTSGDVLAVIDTESSAQETVSPEKPTAQAEAPAVIAITPLSPAVRRLIAENNLDPAQIKGTGKEGRLTKSDVLDYLKKRSGAPKQTADAAPATLHDRSAASGPESAEASPRSGSVVHLDTTPAPDLASRPEQRVPMTRLRARVAERLIEAQQNAAMLTTFNEVNLQHVMDLRSQYKASFENRHGIKLGFMSFFVKASAEALKRFPVVNASIDGQDIIYHGFYDIGIAVSSARGLVVPILRNADQLDFAGIEKSIADFGKKAREGGLGFDDLTGGTFTITNGGIFGSMLSTPILNPPQSAILGMHAIKSRPVVEEDQIIARPMMYLALTYDHRLVDGRDAVQFLATIKDSLEDPARLLLNV